MASCRVFAVWALFSACSVGVTAVASPTVAEAVATSDTFPVKAATKEWCEGNPKFFEIVKAKIDPKNPANNVTVTFTRDANNTNDETDVSLKFDNTGSADFDAIMLSGLAFPANAAPSKLQFAVSGVNPMNDDHFVTVRGQASLDKLGNVTKLTGTIVYEITGTYTIKTPPPPHQSAEVECFASGTFVTGKKL